tara:strand:+ start:3571 stop:4659 length:1089 start_codon:yes stop_codon:yes gene_type:complete
MFQVEVMTAKIEVCIPVRNEAKHIGATINALNNQTFRNFSINVFDNNSDDNTLDICKAQQKDIEIRTHRRSFNVGQTSNINESFINAEAEFVALLSGNDLVSENYLEVLLGELERDAQLGTAYGHAAYVDDNGTPFASQPTNWDFYALLDDDPLVRASDAIAKYCQASSFFALYRKTVLDRMQPQPFCYGGDHIFACEAAIYGKVAFNDQARVGRSLPPGASSPGRRVEHLVNLFSLDQQRGLPNNSRMNAFERITPIVDMFHGYLNMFRLADLPHDDRARLVSTGSRAFLARYGNALEGDIRRFAPIAKRVVEAAASKDIVTRMMVNQALRKIDQCLFLKSDSEMISIRRELSDAYCGTTA